jgi:hypothetical protein
MFGHAIDFHAVLPLMRGAESRQDAPRIAAQFGALGIFCRSGY